MALNRREFLILSAAATCGCAGGPRPVDQSTTPQPASIDAGTADQFATDGVYDHFASQGFFIIRKGDQLIALSSIGTHRSYTLELSADHSFYCKAHGSCFDPTGKVTEGPATRDLQKLPATIDDRGHLIILGRARG